ncbi:glutathione ABC transporter permease GsiC [Thiohalocapsa halophila]|uniref:Glutathione ABC transporter permease GsiC n=1 Tax=Thiohalocapsa halophila TaxID=69359 RepID=A0ABS1CDU7_9GAMM|nr:ABC transporter permease [Thiohalocapsa halophila]MBK1630040.1 glutathione ABC transporter permease GsiC [Thiohalocapsa halophila]
MGGYVVRRLLLLVPVLLGVSLVVFAVMALVPGDPALAILGPYATPERLAELRAELALDQPWWRRWLGWLAGVLKGDMGRSVSLERPVADAVLERLGPTLLLAAAALMLGAVLGLAAGLLAAFRHNLVTDRLVTLSVLLGISLPPFWLGLLLILLFAVWLGWLPASGMVTPWLTEPGAALLTADVLRHLLLPSLSLALVAAGVIGRIGRGAALEVLAADHIRLCRARGLTQRRILLVHALKGVLARVMPVIGLQAGFVLGGAVYIETIFQWPGLGRLLVDAIAARDLLLVQGGVLVLAAAYVLVNLATDLAQHALDRRTAAA